MPPPGVPPQQPQWYGAPSQSREGKSTAFFVAIFLGLLLLVSGALNVLLLILSVGSFAGAGLAGGGDDALGYDLVHVDGSRDAKAQVLRIPVVGAIAEGANPVLGAAGGTVTQVRRALRLLEQDTARGYRGLLLDIDSPGGGVTDSDEIYRMIQAVRKDRPDLRVVALFGDVAASGGYYIASAAQRIFARRTTITGSIGVIMGGWNFAEAAKNFGIEQVAIKSERTPFKDMLSPTRPMRDDERELLTAIVDEFYGQFVTVVDDGRPGLDREQVTALANGAIYTANQALANGLIDAIGDRADVIAWLESEIGQEVEIVEQRRRPGLRDLLLGAEAAAPTLEQSAAQLLQGTTGPRFLYWWAGGR